MDRLDRPFKCSFCSEQFSKPAILDKHSLLHDLTRNFECDICNYRYNNAQQLRIHKKNVHEKKNTEENYPCPKCDRILLNRESYRNHMKRTGHHPYQCKECLKRFWDLTCLEKHSQAHNPLRPFQCDSCNYRFSKEHHLLRHLNIHSSTKEKCK